MLLRHFLNSSFIPAGFYFEEPSDGGSGESNPGGSEGDQNPGGDGGEGETGDTLESIDDYKGALKSARSEAAKYRTKKKELEGQLQELQTFKTKFEKLFGEEEDNDPEKIASERDKLQQELYNLKLKESFRSVAAKNNADADLTWALLKANGKLDGLEPDSTDKLDEIVKAAVESNPKLKAEAADHVGDTSTEGGGGQKKNFDMNGWIRSQANKGKATG